MVALRPLRPMLHPRCIPVPRRFRVESRANCEASSVMADTVGTLRRAGPEVQEQWCGVVQRGCVERRDGGLVCLPRLFWRSVPISSLPLLWLLVCRQSVHNWIARYQQGGLTAKPRRIERQLARAGVGAVADRRDGRRHARGRRRAQGRHRPRPRKRNYRPLFPTVSRPGGEEKMVARRPSRRRASEP
jgi:hypothetical protein